MSSKEISLFSIGMIVGILIYTVSNHFGEQRYSDAIKLCIQNIGPNK